MHPIAQLTNSEASALRGVCFDVDDTLTTQGVLDADAYASLAQLREAGLHLIAATGRPLGWAELFARMWPVDASVGENGAGWFVRSGRHVDAHYAHSADERSDERAQLQKLRALVAERMPQVRESDDSWCRRCDLAFDVGEYDALPKSEVERLVQLIESVGARSVVSTVHAHAAFGTYDKASGIVAAARDALGISIEEERERWLFVGDSGNDAAAFDYFPVSAGVANVSDFLPQLPTPPRYVARQRSGAGFAEIAHTVLARRAGE